MKLHKLLRILFLFFVSFNLTISTSLGDIYAKENLLNNLKTNARQALSHWGSYPDWGAPVLDPGGGGSSNPGNPLFLKSLLNIRADFSDLEHGVNCSTQFKNLFESLNNEVIPSFGTTKSGFLNDLTFYHAKTEDKFNVAFVGHGSLDTQQQPQLIMRNGEKITANDIIALGENSLPKLNAVFLIACHSMTWGSLADAFHYIGANVVLGFMGEINTKKSVFHLQLLNHYLSEGCSVEYSYTEASRDYDTAGLISEFITPFLQPFQNTLLDLLAGLALGKVIEWGLQKLIIIASQYQKLASVVAACKALGTLGMIILALAVLLAILYICYCISFVPNQFYMIDYDEGMNTYM